VNVAIGVKGTTPSQGSALMRVISQKVIS